jgi:hypothetical protein
MGAAIEHVARGHEHDLGVRGRAIVLDADSRTGTPRWCSTTPSAFQKAGTASTLRLSSALTALNPIVT